MTRTHWLLLLFIALKVALVLQFGTRAVAFAYEGF